MSVTDKDRAKARDLYWGSDDHPDRYIDAIAAALAAEREKARAPFLALADELDDEQETFTAYTCPRWHRDEDGWCLDERPHLAARRSADAETLRARIEVLIVEGDQVLGVVTTARLRAALDAQ